MAAQTEADPEALKIAIDLRTKVMARVSAFRGDAADHKEIASNCSQAISRAKPSGQHLWRREPDAHLTRARQQVDFLGCAIDHIRLDYSSPEARQWLATKLGEWAGTFTGETIINLDGGYADLLPALYELGFFLDSTIFIGEPKYALSRIAELDDSALFAKAGLTVQKMATEDDVDRLIALKSEIFRQNPELCWFYLNEGHQQFERRQLAAQLAKPEAIHRYLVYKGGRLVGMYGFDANTVPHWGFIAGMDFAFLPEIRGLGLGKASYKRLFQDMLAEGIAYFIGGTSNPAVLKLATQTFNREVLQYHLRFR